MKINYKTIRLFQSIKTSIIKFIVKMIFYNEQKFDKFIYEYFMYFAI